MKIESLISDPKLRLKISNRRAQIMRQFGPEIVRARRLGASESQIAEISEKLCEKMLREEWSEAFEKVFPEWKSEVINLTSIVIPESEKEAVIREVRASNASVEEKEAAIDRVLKVRS